MKLRACKVRSYTSNYTLHVVQGLARRSPATTSSFQPELPRHNKGVSIVLTMLLWGNPRQAHGTSSKSTHSRQNCSLWASSQKPKRQHGRSSSGPPCRGASCGDRRRSRSSSRCRRDTYTTSQGFSGTAGPAKDRRRCVSCLSSHFQRHAQRNKETNPTLPNSEALARSNHTVTVIGNKAYIFGGVYSNGKLCPIDVYCITLPTTANKTSPADAETTRTEYRCFRAPAAESLLPALLPKPRHQHAACAQGKYMVIHGGLDCDGKPVEEDGNCLWLWDSETTQWSRLEGPTQLDKTLTPRHNHNLFFDESQNFFVLHGGKTSINSVDQPSTETWLYDFHSFAWTIVPATGSPAGPAIATAYVDSTVYTISTNPETGEDTINYLYLQKSTTDREKPDSLVWKSIPFSNPSSTSAISTTPTDATNPIIPPHRDGGAALIPLSTGYGRNYLVYMFGCSNTKLNPTGKTEKEYHSSIYTLQIPSTYNTLASAKDTVRKHLPSFLKSKTSPQGSGEWTWAPVDLVPVEVPSEKAVGGKTHPGPRDLFDGNGAASSCLGGKGVMFWGGRNAKGEIESDGWVLRLAYGYADSARSE